MTASIRCECISWSAFYRLSRKLAIRIQASGFRPDLIIAIGRGGYMPARIISDFCHVMNLTSFKIEHYCGTRAKRTARIRYPLAHGVTGEKVLLVDDVCDTGDTFEVAGRHVADRLQAREVRTAVLHFKQTSSFTPDYFGCRIMKWRWLIYPWAAAEDICELLKQKHPLPKKTEKIREILAREHGVRIPQQVLLDILALSPD